MAQIKLIALLMSIAVITACSADEKQTAEKLNINTELTEAEISAGIFTPEVMWKMGRIGTSLISPDGKNAAYTVTFYSVEANKGVTSVWIISLSDNGKTVKLADDVSDPVWNKTGDKLYVMKDGQIFTADIASGSLAQVSFIDGGIEGFGIAPAENRLFYTKKVAVEKRNSAEIYPDMEKSQAKIYDDLMARHWNYWDEGKYSHIFVAEIKDGKIANGKDIMEGEAWDAPMAPYFDIAEIAWNGSGTQLAYTCKKQTGTEYAVSTQSDIFVYDVQSETTKNICREYNESKNLQEFQGYDKYPVWSPDDTKIAFRSMRRAGNESDRERLFVWNSSDNSMTDLTPTFDYNATNVVWDGNDMIYFIAPIEATHQICRVNCNTQKVEVLTSGDHDINHFTKKDDIIIAEITKISMATEIFKININDNLNISQISFVNKNIYDNIKMGEVQKRMVQTTDGKQMLTWLIFPPDFDATKQYPVLLYCEGGPQSVVSQFWSYRWNFQLMAAQGYVIVAPNRRGVPSFGQEWLDQISGDYSGQNIHDYLSAIDNAAKEPWCDNTRLGCVGASYGGYSVFFLAGNHNKRFKAFISHCGIFNFESMYGHTEELWFVNNDYGGSYWSENPVAKRSYANSPHKFVAKWDTPILIITGLNDFRIPYTQSLEAFTAARLRGIDARLVAFENEAHQVFKPQNNLVWNREFFGWLNKYLK
ncbi:MAG: alpha/beta fold hydrolase [Prevotellaceae bacterium]|jgi:dipeptidyl aminopeptidase/acylaminoacyl peptidase|nr:alpha/beta fold hydrolase [Prevotellaceae bacterium]